MNQVFITIFLPKNIRSRKIYRYKFSGKQACLSEGVSALGMLGLIVYQASNMLKRMYILHRGGLRKLPSFLAMPNEMRSCWYGEHARLKILGLGLDN